jgi:simple sugar transport system permease protein
MKKTKRFAVMDYFSAIRILAAIVLSLLLVFVVIFFVADDPLLAISKLMFGPLETKRGFFNVVERATPLIFCALAVNVSLRAGVFNMAVDGSFYMGAVIASVIALKTALPVVVYQILYLLAALLGGGLINMLPVVLNRYTGISPTVIGIMSNYIFYYFGVAIVSMFLLEGTGSWGTAPFPDAARFGSMLRGTNMHWGILIMLAMIVLVVILMQKTSLGYKIRLTGANPDFARTAGINAGAFTLGAQFIGGAIGGMGGAVEMMGIYKRFQWQTRVSYVWDGLMIHMLANQNPVLIPFTAFFVAYLRIGAEIMSRSTNLDPEVVAFLQGIVILLVASDKFLYFFKKRHEQKLALRQAVSGEAD